jgi:hypothetical protein
MSPCGDVTWEFTLESWHNVIECKSVSGEMNPSRLLSEDSKCLSWPETVMLMPASNIRLSHLHIIIESIDVEFPSSVSTLIFKILFEDGCPLLASNVVIDVLSASRNIHLVDWHFLCYFNI